MAYWRVVALVSVGALGLGACSPDSSVDDDGSGGESGDGGSGKGGSGGSGGSVTLPKPCGALTSTEASNIATDNVARVLHAAVNTARFTEGSELIARVLNGGEATTEPFEFGEEMDADIDDYLQSLRDEILTEANVESRTTNSVTFHLTPEVNCKPDPDDLELDPAFAEEMRQDCVADLAAHPVRYVISRVDCNAGDSVTIALDMGGNHRKPGALIASPSSLTLSLDVAEILHAIEDDGGDVHFDADSGGSATFKLDTSSTSEATFTGSSESLVVGALTNEEPVRVSVARSPELVTVSANAATGVFSGGFKVGETNVTFPFHALMEAFGANVVSGVTPQEVVDAFVPGLSAGFRYERSSDTLGFENIGLGDAASVLSHSKSRLLELNLTPRTFGAGFELGTAGPVVHVDPSAELGLRYSFASVASKVENLWDFAYDDHVAFSAAGSPSIALLEDEEGFLRLFSRDTGAALRVDSGSFGMSSTALPNENVAVGAGQCMLFDEARSGEHDILRGYYAGTCP